MNSIFTPRSLRQSWLLIATIVMTFVLAAVPHSAFAQVPDPDDAVPLSATTAEDTLVSINTGLEADNRYRVSIIQPGPAHGTVVGGVVIVGGQDFFTLEYTPGANRTDSVSFQYQICVINDPARCGAPATAMVDITPVNDGPIANPDAVTTPQNQAITIDVVANDNGGPNEPNDRAYLLDVASQPANGTATISDDKILYTPDDDFCSTTAETFTYTIYDDSGLQAAGTVTVMVTCPNTPVIKLGNPYMVDDHNFAIDVLLNSPDVEVSAIDFFLNLNTCVLDVDVPSNNKFADDVTTTLNQNSFLFQVEDELFPDALHFVAASVSAPASILAGPNMPTRTIATMKFKADPSCVDAATGIGTIPFDLDDATAGFTGPQGTDIDGTVEDKTAVVVNANNRPTNINLSNNTIPEDVAIPAFIGELTTVDADAGDTFIYQKMSGPAEISLNPAFNDELILNAPLEDDTYDVTIKTTDQYGASHTKIFEIVVTRVNEAPTANDDGLYTVRASRELDDLLDNDNDPDDADPADPSCQNCSIQSVTNGTHGMVINNGLSATYVTTDATFLGRDVFTYTLTDNDPTGPLTDKAVVEVRIRRDKEPGDCNGNGDIEAGDLTATGLELFDGDDNSKWYEAPKGDYAFSAYGCNSNQNSSIDAGDITCTAIKIFGGTCNTVAAASSVSAELSVASNVNATRGDTVSVPVSLYAVGNAVSGAAFAVNFDADTFDFASVELHVADGLMDSVNHDAATGRVEIIVADTSMNPTAFADGALATINLTVKEDAAEGSAAISLSESSLGSVDGQSVPVEASNGSVEVSDQEVEYVDFIFLPFIGR